MVETSEEAADAGETSLAVPRTIALVGLMGAGKSCIGRMLAAALGLPFVDADKEIEAAGSTADNMACIAREQKVWNVILNETYRGLRGKLDEQQQVKLRDMQRAWIASRDKTCAFYWDYFQGTMASPMSASCENRETGRRALFLLGFLNDAEGK